MIRGSYRRCSVNQVFWEISQNSQKNSCARVSFLVRLQARGFSLTIPRFPRKSRNRLNTSLIVTLFCLIYPRINKDFFSIRVFFHRHWRFTGQQGKGQVHLLFHSTTSTLLWTLRHLFATLHVRWLSHIFNRNACIYQTATQWDLPPYRITIWLIDWRCNVCLFTWWIDSRFLLQWFDMGNRWIWIHIDYHPCITNEPTNQACKDLIVATVLIARKLSIKHK